MELYAEIITDFTIKKKTYLVYMPYYVDYLLHTILGTDYLYYITQK